MLPTSLDDFATFPLVAALDPTSGLASDPSSAMDLLSTSFPPQQGTFWFAAGIAFTSFALINVVAVVAVEVGHGFMLTLLGLATAALPTPYFPLAQIQLALMAEFSTADGVLEVLAQLTDQSFLLDPDCRLTGGFAYASWFAPNPNAGQFVVTLGGYHASFHHDGYPDVPRVGYRWCIGGVLTIIGATYFALTSEAIMAGTSFTAALTLGPVWASLALGVDAIVYFDPFKFSAHAYASIAAGVTFSVDLFFGTITVSLSFHLGADVLIEGPSLHGSASLDLDVTSVTISFGSTDDSSTPMLDWPTFAAKYLTAGGTTPILATAPTGGVITPAGSGPPPDGSAALPWRLLPEFAISFSTSAAATAAALPSDPNAAFPPVPGTAPVNYYPTTGVVAIAPMGLGAIESTLGITVTSDSGEAFAAPVFAAAPGPPLSVALTTAAMPKGVWAPQLPSGSIPTGDTITAGNGLVLTGRAQIAPGSPAISYSQVDVEAPLRRPLPFALEQDARPTVVPDAENASAFWSASTTNPPSALDQAAVFLAGGPYGTPPDPYAAAAFVRNRVAPPRLALLTDGLAPVDPSPPVLTPVPAPIPVVVDFTVHPPTVTALLGGGPSAVLRPVIRTTAPSPFVGGPFVGASLASTPLADAPFIGSQLAGAPAGGSEPAMAGTTRATGNAPPVRAPALTLAAVAAALDPALGARITRIGAGPVAGQTGLMAGGGGAATQRAGTPVEALRTPGADPATTALLVAQEQALLGNGAALRPGELLVTTLPNHEGDADPQAPRPTLVVAGDAAVRVVALSGPGEILADTTVAPAVSAAGVPQSSAVTVPQHTAILVAWCVGGAGVTPAGLSGWSATDRLPYVGAGVTLAAGAVVTGLAAPDRAFRAAEAAWASVAAPAARAIAVTTTLPAATTVVVVSIDTGPGAELTGLSLGLDGATRPLLADASTAPPTLVAAGGRSHLVYDVVPSGTGPVVVSVGTGPAWRLAGVLGGPADAAVTAARIAAGGAGTVAQPLVQGPTGLATIQWLGLQGVGRAQAQASDPLTPGSVS